MRMKLFTAPDMREGIRQIREELGPDAIILSSQKTAQGIEIAAAIDYDDQEPGAAHSGPAHRQVAAAPRSFDQAYHSSLLTESQRVREEAQISAGEPGLTPADGSVPDSAMEQLGNEIRGLRGLLLHQLSSLAWSDLERRHPVRASVLRRLMDLGLSRRVGGLLVEKIPETLSSKAAWHRALALLAHAIPIQPTDLMDEGGVIALLGPTGVGKTTAAAKLAARFALQNGPRSVALITTDSYRIGAHEQLRTFAQIMDIPLRVAHDEASLGQALGHFYDRRLVLIDTAGMSQRDVRFSEQIKLIGGGSPLVRNYLVVSSTTQMLAVEQAIKAFTAARIDACVITKLDETTSLGGTMSALITHRVPAAYLGDGQRVPEDLSIATAHGLVTKAVAIAQAASAQTGSELADKPYLNLAGQGVA